MLSIPVEALNVYISGCLIYIGSVLTDVRSPYFARSYV